MVIDMQEAELTMLLSQYEENSVTEFEEFGEIVPPNGIGNLKFIWVVSLPARFTYIAVSQSSRGS